MDFTILNMKSINYKMIVFLVITETEQQTCDKYIIIICIYLYIRPIIICSLSLHYKLHIILN